MWLRTHNEVVVAIIVTTENIVATVSIMLPMTGVGIGGDKEADVVVAADLQQNVQRREVETALATVLYAAQDFP